MVVGLIFIRKNKQLSFTRYCNDVTQQRISRILENDKRSKLRLKKIKMDK